MSELSGASGLRGNTISGVQSCLGWNQSSQLEHSNNSPAMEAEDVEEQLEIHLIPQSGSVVRMTYENYNQLKDSAGPEAASSGGCNGKEFCRLCAQEIPAGSGAAIFREASTTALLLQIKTMLPIGLESADGLPATVCLDCIQKLANCYSFYHVAVKADESFRIKHIKPAENGSISGAEGLKVVPGCGSSGSVGEREVFKCRFCYLLLDSVEECVEHSVVSHQRKPVFPCPLCKCSFSTPDQLRQHLDLKHPQLRQKRSQQPAEEMFVEMLEQTFDEAPQEMVQETIEIQMDEAVPKHHAAEDAGSCPLYPCQVCGKQFKRLSRLKKHVEIHNISVLPADLCVCSACHEAFASELHEAEHICRDNWHTLRLTAKMVFKCEFCEKCFVDTDCLNKHRKEHDGPNPFTCNICRAQFSSYAGCTSHKTAHGPNSNPSEKLFPVTKFFLCDVCDNIYIHWKELRSHHRTKHSGQQTHNCRVCQQTFATYSKLSYHVRVQHKNCKAKCEDCKTTFVNSATLKKHRMTFHRHDIGSTYTTDVDDELASSSSSASTAAVSTSWRSLQSTRLNSDRPYWCKMCGLTFQKYMTLQNHKAIHKKFSSFQCLLCYKELRCKSDLRKHTKLEHSKEFTIRFDPEDDGYEEEPEENFEEELVLAAEQAGAVQEIGQQHCVDDTVSPAVPMQETEEITGDISYTPFVGVGNGIYVKIEKQITINGQVFYFVDDQSSIVLEGQEGEGEGEEQPVLAEANETELQGAVAMLTEQATPAEDGAQELQYIVLNQ